MTQNAPVFASKLNWATYFPRCFKFTFLNPFSWLQVDMPFHAFSLYIKYKIALVFTAYFDNKFLEVLSNILVGPSENK